MSKVYQCEINEDHPVAQWLFFECEGPWRVIVVIRSSRKVYMAFARAADALMFRLLQSE